MKVDKILFWLTVMMMRTVNKVDDDIQKNIHHQIGGHQYRSKMIMTMMIEILMILLHDSICYILDED